MKPEPRQRRHRKVRSAGIGMEYYRNVWLSQETAERDRSPALMRSGCPIQGRPLALSGGFLFDQRKTRSSFA